MTGVRDLSLIATPPVDRLAIRTYVAPFEKNMIREALQKNIVGDKAFFVVPRLSDIDEVTRFFYVKKFQKFLMWLGMGSFQQLTLMRQ